MAWSAQEAVDAGLRTTGIWELTRPVMADSDHEVRSHLAAMGVEFTSLGSLTAG